MPAGAVEEQGDVVGVGDGPGEAVEELLHRGGVHLGQDQRKGVVGLDLTGCEDIGEGEALIGGARRTLAFWIPAVTHAAFLADARLVLEEDAQALFRAPTDDFAQDVGSPF